MGLELEKRLSEIQSKEEIQALIHEAESLMLQSPDQIEIPHINYFSKGVYGREIKIPKGAFIVGKIHKYENFNILSKGKLSIISVDGCVTVEAPYSVVSSPGVKRFAYAHEDSVWTTVHGTNEKDVDKIEKKFIAKNYSEVPKLGIIKRGLSWLGLL
jgi:hypothetical protein